MKTQSVWSLFALLVITQAACGGGGGREAVGPPTFRSQPVTAAVEGARYSYRVEVGGSPTPTLFATGQQGAPLPAWLTFDAARSELAGTPTAADVGLHVIELTASNGLQPDAFQAFAVDVQAASPTPASPTLSIGSIGAGGTGTGTTGGTGTGGTGSGTGSGGTAAGGGAGTQTGTGSGPGTGTTGGQTPGTGTGNANAVAPVFTSTPPTTATVGSVLTYVASASGSPAPTFSAVNLPTSPAWLRFDAATATLTGTPPAGTVGGHPITLRASNAGGSADQSFRVFVQTALAPGIVLAEDFEAGFVASGPGPQTVQLQSGVWTSAHRHGTSSDWDISAPNSSSSSFGRNPAPPVNAQLTQAYAGSQCAGTNNYGSYDSEVGGRTSYLQTPQIDLTGTSQPALRFHHFYEIENEFDGANLKISWDGGQTFQIVDSLSTYSGTIDGSYDNPLGGEEAWFGVSYNWTEVTVDLGSHLPAQAQRGRVVLRFEFAADRSQEEAGWYLDEVYVGERTSLP